MSERSGGKLKHLMTSTLSLPGMLAMWTRELHRKPLVRAVSQVSGGSRLPRHSILSAISVSLHADQSQTTYALML